MKFTHFLPILLAGHRAAATDQDILDIAKGGGFDTLVAALEASGLDHVFDVSFWCSTFGWGCSEYTVFAPTDDAFAALPAGTLDRLLSEDFLPHLKDLLSYHAAHGAIRSDDIADGAEVEALNDEVIVASVDGDDISLNGDTSVVAADIEASNGVVHAVDKVLLPGSAANNIAEVAAANGLDTLVALLTRVGLDSLVADADKALTVFAPTDAAFAALVDGGFDADDDAAVADLLAYHVVEGDVLAELELFWDPRDLVTVQGSPISVDVAGWGWYKELALNGDAGVALADVLASNGIIHVVDKVLMPPTPPGDIPAVASGNGDFSTLVEALVKADLVETLQGEGPFTVFAPTNAAFEKAGMDVDALTKDELAPVLLYHVLAGSTVLEDDISSGIIQTNPLSPTNLLVNLYEGWWSTTIWLNSKVQVTATDVLASNGVIHAIDDVLLPPKNLFDLADGDARLSKLAELLVQTGLDTVLSGDGPFTVLAPSDDAFDRLGDTGLSTEELGNVLRYHVVPGNVPLSALEEGDVGTLFAKAGAPQTVAVDFWYWYVYVKGDENTEAANVIEKDVVAANGVVHVIDEVLLPSL